MHLHLRGPTVFVDACRRQALRPQPTAARSSLRRVGVGLQRRSRVVAVGFSGCRRPAGRSGLGAEQAVRELGVDPFELLDRARARPARAARSSRTSCLRQRRTAIGCSWSGWATRRRRTSAGPAPRSLERPPACGTVATSIGSLADDDQLGALVEGLVLGGFGFSRRSDGAGAEPLTVTLTDLGAPSRGDARGGRRRRGRAGDGVVAGTLVRADARRTRRARPAGSLGTRGRRRRRTRPRGLGREAAGRRRVSAASSPSDAARRTTRGCCAWTTRPTKSRRRARRTSCSSARASRSTPVACRSSPVSRWRR